jgi:hypothetical protein
MYGVLNTRREGQYRGVAHGNPKKENKNIDASGI